ncbi:MAG: DpnII family type II restriction endonuclease [Patescibacteria group bacterium]|nr:DpnII family type II restriction endonuclease [Patescibacteria group bacterium]
MGKFKNNKKITERYFAKRVLNEFVPEEWIQAILDSNSSRKKGKCGEVKLLSILQKLNIDEVKTWNDFLTEKKCVAQFSKVFSLNNVRDKLGVKIKTKKQNKDLDLIIKIDKKIFIVEAKHLNTSGGGQDKQIAELIEITNLKEKNENVFYIAFLDGNYSNILLGSKKCGDKLKTQRKEIKKYLKNNSRNYWLNTAGFNALFFDLINF